MIAKPPFVIPVNIFTSRLTKESVIVFLQQDREIYLVDVLGNNLNNIKKFAKKKEVDELIFDGVNLYIKSGINKLLFRVAKNQHATKFFMDMMGRNRLLKRAMQSMTDSFAADIRDICERAKYDYKVHKDI